MPRNCLQSIVRVVIEGAIRTAMYVMCARELMLLSGLKMKWCPKCKSWKELSEFHRCSKSKDGLQYSCKECSKKEGTKWAKGNPEKVAEIRARWEKNNPKKRAESHAKADRKQRAKHPEKKAARNAVTHALRDGRLVKEPCHCGEVEVEGHHKSYEEDKQLDVEWLCTKCHRKLERKETDESQYL